MQSCILFILGFIQLILCSKPLNLSVDENESVCPYTLFRRKRANAEYTRWRSNVETTAEFIVKVLDDEVQSTPIIQKQVVAVNIQPITKRGEKIIVGGAMVGLPTTTPPSELARDYTRFVPPTTVPVTKVADELYLAPVPVVKEKDPIKLTAQLARIDPSYSKPILTEGRHALRDESPPAGPQFLARSPPPIARQFAPIAPVAFTRRPLGLPMTPPMFDLNNIPQRSTQPDDTLVPARTISDEFQNFQPYLEEINTNELVATRTSLEETPVRSTVELLTDKNDAIIEDEDEILKTTKYPEINFRKYDKLSPIQTTEKDADYHNMFYNEDYKENVRKKGDKEAGEGYDDKEKEHEENYVFDKEPAETLSREFLSSVDNVTSLPVFAEEEHVEIFSNNTVKMKKPDTFAQVLNNDISSEGKMDRSKRRPVCSLLTIRQLNFNSPRTLSEIIVQLKQWAEDSPVARWVDITNGNYTTMENPIYMMIVDDPSSGQIVSAKQTVMVVSGIQGRDHHAVAAAMYLLYQLIERSEAHSDLLTKYRFWVIPVFNPDGYDYSMTFPHRREWMKNLRQSWSPCKGRESCKACATYGLRCTIQPCYGVNLDRNFEYQWIPTEELQAEHPCGTLYAGTRQLSEIETKALTHFLHNQRTPLFTFIAFKEGDVLGVMYPYSHTRKRRAFDHVYRHRASRAASAAYSIGGRPYVAGQTSEFLPLYAGGIEDWIDGHLGIDNTYTIMIFRSTDSYNSKLVTERVVHEAYAAMDTLLLQSIEPLSPPVAPTSVRASSGRISASCLLIISFTILDS